MKRYFVYELIDPQTEQPFYIGAGSGTRHKKRLEDHLLEAKSDKWTNEAKCQRIVEITARGETPELTVHECVDETHCATVEKDLIKKFGRLCDGGILTNVHPGGGGIKGIRHGANKNGRLKPKNVYQFDLEGKLLKCFPAVTQAAAEMGVSHTAIINCISGRNNTKSVAGYQWSYSDQSPGKLQIKAQARKTTYKQFDLKGNFIACYTSGREMQKATGVDPSSVYKHIKGQLMHAGGFRWEMEKGE